VNTTYEVFISFLSTIIGRYAKTRVQSSYRLPWYTKGLKKYQNLRNKFYKRYIESGDAADFDRYKQHKRVFEFLNKLLYKYSQYIADIECKLTTNPKAFWHFVNSKRTTSYFPSLMSYESILASSDIGVANLFANYYASNFEPSSLWNDDDSLSRHDAKYWVLRCY